MDFSMEDTQNSAPDAPTMAEVAKLSTSGRKADTQSVTKRYVAYCCSCPRTTPATNRPTSHNEPADTAISSLQSELMTLMLSPTPGISAFPDADGNLMHWTATIVGPTETPYAGLTLKLSFAFP